MFTCSKGILAKKNEFLGWFFRFIRGGPDRVWTRGAELVFGSFTHFTSQAQVSVDF